MEFQARWLRHATMAGAAAIGLSAIAGAGAASAAAHTPTMRGSHLSLAALRADVARAQAHTLAPAVRNALARDAKALMDHRGVPNPDLKPLPIPKGSVGEPASLAVSPNGKLMYISAGSLFDRGPVYVLDLSDLGAAAREIQQSGGSAFADAGPIALSPNGKELYITNESGSGDPVFIAAVGGSGATNNMIDGSVSAGTVTIPPISSLAVAPNGKTLYISADPTAEGPFSVGNTYLDAATITSSTAGVVETRYTAPNLGDGSGLALSSNGKLLYAANWFGAASVSKVSGTSITSTRALPEVYDAADIALSPDGRTLYADVSSVFGAVIGAEGGVPSPASEIDTFAMSGSGMTATLAHSSLLPASAFTLGMTLDPSGTTGYVTNATLTSSSPEVAIDSFAIPAAATKVAIVGSARSGKSVTAKVTGIAGSSRTYRWLANGKAIKGAHGAKLKLTSKLKSKKLTVKVTATAVGYHRVTVTSKAVRVK